MNIVDYKKKLRELHNDQWLSLVHASRVILEKASKQKRYAGKTLRFRVTYDYEFGRSAPRTEFFVNGEEGALDRYPQANLAPMDGHV